MDQVTAVCLTCLMVVNSVLRERIDKKDFVEVSVGVVKRLVKDNKELLTLMKGNSIDLKRVRQADKNIMQGIFVKFKNYIKMLHLQGKVLWRSAYDIPPDCLLNMDEIATNSHNDCKRLIADKLHLGRLFQEVNAGDNKMPMHISLCITSQPKGK